jgi:hypothetical protein
MITSVSPFAFGFCLLSAGGLAMAQDQAPAPAADQEVKSGTAIPVGLSEPLGPPNDPFNDTKTQGHVWGGLRYVPDVNLAYYHETNPTKVAANGPGDNARVLYTTLTVSDAQGGPRKVFVGVAQTRFNQVSLGSDPRRVLTYQDRFSVAGWSLPVRLGYNADVVSRSSFLSRKANTELGVTVKSAGLDANRQWDGTRLGLAWRYSDVRIGSAATAEGVTYRSTNSNAQHTLRAKLTQPVSEATEMIFLAQSQSYAYRSAGTEDPVNPTSDVMTVTVGAQHQPTEAVVLAADIGRARKTSGRTDLVPAATHGVGSLKAGYTPSDRTEASVAYAAGVEELNDTGVSNLKTGTWSLGFGHRITPSLATTVSFDRTRVTTRELDGKVIDSKFYAALLWKPDPRVLVAVAFSRTRRQVSDGLQDFVQPFSNNRYLVNVTYYL